MADVKPFICVRPEAKAAARVAALPYDVYNREEALQEVQREPLSFLNIDRPETHFGPEVAADDPRVYEKAAALLQAAMDSGVYRTDPVPCYYLYELSMEGRSQTGVVGCASVDDYLTGIIRKHENTRADKEEDRVRHVEACGAQTGPIFLAYRGGDQIRQIVAEVKKGPTLYDFISPDGIGHRVWRIAEEERIQGLQEGFRQIGSLYIADGHHRAASAVRVACRRRAEQGSYTGLEEWNSFLAVLFCQEELRIWDYNRVVRDLNGLTPGAFLQKLEEKCRITGCGAQPVCPQAKGEMGLYLEENWYHLTAREEYCQAGPVESLDVEFLQREVLAPILGITDPRMDPRIDFIGGIRGLGELERRCRTDMKAAFAMYPTDMAELLAVADAGLLMPPKSTWFEPKLRSGLFLHRI